MSTATTLPSPSFYVQWMKRFLAKLCRGKKEVPMKSSSRIALWMMILLAIFSFALGAMGEGTSGDSNAREDFIERMIALAEEKYDAAGGRAQRAQYSGDIYVCKNFTVYLFRENREDFRMAEFPDVPLVIPDNQPKDDCKPYVYGIEWKDVSAGEGNPFYAAASFRYDDNLSKKENEANARAFLMEAQRGDFFQMAAKYYYGTGAHSMVITGDYNPETDTILWTDSNMKGEKRNGERYGYVQFNAEKDIDWFVDAFCRKKYGATLYRLRDDIVYVK